MAVTTTLEMATHGRKHSSHLGGASFVRSEHALQPTALIDHLRIAQFFLLALMAHIHPLAQKTSSPNLVLVY